MKEITVGEIREEGGVKLVTFHQGDLAAVGIVDKEDEIEARKQDMVPLFGHLAKQKEEEEKLSKVHKATTKPLKNKKKGGCCGGKKTFGFMSMLQAKLSGPVDLDIASARINLCFTCQEQDDEGELLYRELGGTPYCGQPRMEKVWRDEKAKGCGCDLDEKVRYRVSACPRGKWGPV